MRLVIILKKHNALTAVVLFPMEFVAALQLLCLTVQKRLLVAQLNILFAI
jgi:hypothetical protein